jgi:hypothetical protein
VSFCEETHTESINNLLSLMILSPSPLDFLTGGPADRPSRLPVLGLTLVLELGRGLGGGGRGNVGKACVL